MNDRQFRSLARYIRDCARRMGLAEWELRLHTAPCDPSADAAVTVVRDVHVANIQVGSDFADLSAERQRICIAHELCHIPMLADIDYMESVIPGLIGSVAWTPIDAAIRTMHEQGIDLISKALAPALPLWDCPK